MQEIGQLAILCAFKMLWESFMQSSICICTPVTHVGRFGNYLFLVIFLHIRRGKGSLEMKTRSQREMEGQERRGEVT